MSREKKHWRLSTPFRRFSGTQDPCLKAKVGRSGSRVSSVYLRDDSSTSDFVIVPEFDYPVRTQTTYTKSNHNSHSGVNLPAVTSSESRPLSPSVVDGYPINLAPIGSQYSQYSYFGGASRNTPVVNAGHDDLTQRLGFAYDYIHSMSSAASPKVLLSSDPQMLRKQLGVPQHSVLNHPIHSSPDLPNPHASPREPTSPGSLLIAPPLDMSHASISKKLDLSINMDTNVHPSPAHHLRDPIQPAQSKSVVATSTRRKNTAPRCSPLGTPCSAHATRMLEPQPSNPEQSKLVECRVEKTTSPPSHSLSGRQPPRNVLRKPGADTPPSANAHRRQTSLPQIRPPSPFRFDLPLHHQWHERRTDFDSFAQRDSKITRSHETSSRRTSGGTEVLASLAWVGAPYTANRRCHPTSPTFFPDCFSMDIAVGDESISDDILVDRLEKVRRTGGPCERSRDVSTSRSSNNFHFHFCSADESTPSSLSCPPPSPRTSEQFAKLRDVPLHSPPISKETPPDSEDAAVWQATKKALLCIREIVRTEKRYQEALKMLLNAQTATPPPPSMAPYVSALVRVSEMLLKCFIEDPSAWGVSTAFVASEDELEATMVSWCGVAGAFFTDGDSRSSNSAGRWRLRRSGVMSSPFPSVTKRISIPPSPQLLPTFSMIGTASKIKEQTADEYCAGQHPQAEQVTAESPQKLGSTNSQSLAGQPPSRKLSVRDLAIQPIQRVMRYVLLYRDLLDCTPATSPPRLLVERALEAATRIANQCDRAQKNPAFCAF